jgi:REP element-mobilizing transposase RayT
MQPPERKQIRLTKYDYSNKGAYFITICTNNRQKLFWNNAVGTPIGRPELSKYGQIVEIALNNIPIIYPETIIDKYVVMPNHIHLILMLSAGSRRTNGVPTISHIINQMKGYASK